MKGRISNPQKRILYFYTTLSSFVRKDIKILSKKFQVKQVDFNPLIKLFAVFIFFKHFFTLLFRIWQVDVIVCQFGGYHTLLPTIFGKLFFTPCVIIVGGTDCVSFPSISYGNFSNKLLSFFTSLSYRFSNHIIAVDESLVFCRYDYQNRDYDKQGILSFCENLKTPITVIHNGYDSSFWSSSILKTKNKFITVAAGLESDKIKYLKGIDLIIDIAPKFPDCEFIIIGANNITYDLGIKSSNVTVISEIKNSKLPSYYGECEFYLQLSISEGFPNAISEAMLCGCIPIGSNVGGIPNIIGNTGFLLYKRDLKELEVLINEAISCDKKALAISARKRIVELFSEINREEKLTKLIQSIS